MRVPKIARTASRLTSLLLAALVAACGSSTPPPINSPTPDSPTPTAAPATAAPTTDPTATPTESPSAPPTEAPTATAEPTETPEVTPPPVDAQMPFVPVVNFWSTRDSIARAELSSTFSGGPVAFVEADRAAISEALGGAAPQGAGLADAAAVVAAVKGGAMGILRATEVHPSVRALAVDGVNLFGNDHIEDVSEWPLLATVETAEPWDQSATWTLVAVGDMMFDRGVITQLNEAGGDKEHLFNGGTSRVTRLRCCSFFGYQYPTNERTGNRGLVREMLTAADLTIGNLESGVLYGAPHHPDPRGFRFTADASWMPVLAANGFDLLSNANNHAMDGGRRGLTQAIQAITEAGMVPAGAGVAGEAEAPRYLEANGVRVAVIACDAIRGGAPPTADRVATLNCRRGPIVDSIREARQNADVVIVFPHWGTEYERPANYQYEMSREWIDAGADMIIGAHSHFPGGIYEYEGRVSLLSLGNFIFDQDFRQTTQQGLVAEITFNGGGGPVQIWVHPLLNVDAQPNFAVGDDAQWAFDVMRWQSPPSRLDWGGGPTPNFGNTPRK